MKSNIACAAAIILGTGFGTAALGGTDFGSLEEAREVASALSGVIQSSGLDTGISAMHDPDHPFTGTKMGVHIFQDSVLLDDNREPELEATSYAEVADLTEQPMWPRIRAAAESNSEAQLKWYHYDTEEVYTYDCYSEIAMQPDVVVMVCL